MSLIFEAAGRNEPLSPGDASPPPTILMEQVRPARVARRWIPRCCCVLARGEGEAGFQGPINYAYGACGCWHCDYLPIIIRLCRQNGEYCRAFSVCCGCCNQYSIVNCIARRAWCFAALPFVKLAADSFLGLAAWDCVVRCFVRLGWVHCRCV